jgi:Rieske Fe-S protein
MTGVNAYSCRRKFLAMLNENSSNVNSGRRAFLKKLTVLGGLSATGGMLVACGASPTSTPAPPPAGFDTIGESSKFKADADPQSFTAKSSDGRDIKGYVYNKGGEYFVYSNVCTHAACEVVFTASQAKHVCPCHQSEFDKTGAVVKEPATERLPRYEARAVGNMLYAKFSS